MRKSRSLGRHFLLPEAASLLPPLKSYAEIPQEERAIAVYLCLQRAATWQNFPSKASKFLAALVAKAYSAPGQAASTLHAMALLQVHQTKALKELHEGYSEPGLFQELCTATGLALARLCPPWLSRNLNLAEMDTDKARFLDAPISQAGFFGNTVEDFAQQFSAVQKKD